MSIDMLFEISELIIAETGGGLDIREESFFSLFLCSGLSGLRPMGKSNISDYVQAGCQ